MLKDPFHWFPDPYFSTILFVLVVLVDRVDILIPRLANRGRVDRPVRPLVTSIEVTYSTLAPLPRLVEKSYTTGPGRLW